MFQVGPGATVSAMMMIEIRLDSAEPIAGRVCTDAGESKPFAGWLQLLRILADSVVSLVPSRPGLPEG
jgi:hypothetical protein